MPKITSKAQLNVGVELTVNETTKTITLNVAGNLVAKDGVSIQALYSKLVDLWNTSSYQDSPFPMYAIDVLSGQFQFGTDGATYSGWKPADDATRNMLRDGGWSEYSSGGVLNRQYAGFIGLGSVNSGAQPYYQLTSVGTPVDFPFADQFNAGVQVFGDATNGNFDTRAYAKTYVREYGKKYKDSVLADTGKSSTGANRVDFLISNEDDLKIQAADGSMSASPYSGITITYFATDQNRSIGGINYPFRVIVNGNSATLAQVYTKVQYLLRQATDIDNGVGTVIGKTAAQLLSFTGDTLTTTNGVYVDNIQTADSNSIVFTDQNGVARINPYTSIGVLIFNSFLIGVGSSYRLMFTTPPGAGNDYGEAGAVTVNDAAGTPITGTISASPIAFTYDYDGNTQAGFTAATDRPVTMVGIRPGAGKFTAAVGTLTKSKSISISLTAEQDRAYSS